MKKFLYLTKNELKRVKKSFILTAIILTIFLAALFGMLSVQTDIMRNLCEFLDAQESSFDLTASSAYDGSNNVTFGDFGKYNEKFIYGQDEDFSRGNIVSQKGVEFDTWVVAEIEEEHLASYSFVGNALCLNDGLTNYLKQYSERLTGRWVQNPWEICLSRFVAEQLGAQIGEKVTICDVQFTVTGIYDWEDDDLAHGVFDILAAHVFTVGADTPLRKVRVNGFDSSSDLFTAYRQLQRKGFLLDSKYGYFYENINLMQAIFSAVDVIFGVVIVVALYSLVSMLFRQRKTQICRLKILGASDGLVAMVYCGIVVTLLVIVVACATGLGVGFNYYFVDLCEQLFEFEFTAHFNYLSPVVSLAAFCGVIFLLWEIVNHRTKTALATEIRYE